MLFRSDRDAMLTQCYTNCFKTATKDTNTSHRSITMTLLGTGVKLIDVDVSARSLQKSLISFDANDVEGKRCGAELSVELVLSTLQSCDQVLEVFKS